MKSLYTTFITLALATSALAGKITAVQNNGQWNTNSTWNLNRTPQDNDTIVIPAGINVILNYNCSLNNVYIKILGTLTFSGGKLDLDALGNIMIYTGGSISGTNNGEQIRIGGVHKYKGSEGTLTGPAQANITTGSAPNGFASLLPVKFISFYVRKSGLGVELTWSTAEEKNNSHFQIERSADGRNWKDVAVVFAAANSFPVNQYQYNDKFASTGTIYYRLKQVDKDGQFSYSTIKTIYGDNRGGIAKIYVASTKTIAIEFNEQITGNVLVRVISMNGQSIHEQVISQPSYRYEMKVTNALSGTYAVQIISDGKPADVKKVVL
ncbi:MAG TPA: G8 domain-containing protein [Flavitalea sp.]|nr:G8 domain-containing protein [Flavitalea sp.]